MNKQQGKAARQWAALTVRQQYYLKTLFDLDQKKEDQRDLSWEVDRVYQSIPAAEWRAITPVELQGALGKIPSGEQWESIIEELLALKLIEVERDRDGHGKRLTRFRVERAGRAVVRAGLNIPPRGKLRRAELSENQERYARAIADADLAPLEEVRAAFLEKSAESSSKIQVWGDQLKDLERRARERAEERWREAHTRFVPCAYPGCEAKIKVEPTYIPGGFPKPVRKIMIWNIAQGDHYEKNGETGEWARKSNNTEELLCLYGCSPAHSEAIARMSFRWHLQLDPEQEQFLAQVVYPMILLETRLAVSDLGRTRAIAQVTQARAGVVLATEKRALQALARLSIEQLIEETMAGGAMGEKAFTDNLKLFRRLYTMSFVDGWLMALKKREPHESEQP